MAGDLALPRLAQSLRSLTDVRTFLRPVLVVWPAAGLVLGLAAHFFGWEYWAGPVWAAATAPVLVVLLIEIVAGLRRGDVGLDVVAALAMLAALLFAEYLAAAVVAVMYSGGQYLESFAERRASREMSALLARVPRTALRQRNGGLEEVSLEAVEPGDRLVIRKGDVVPVDGAVADGTAVLDQSALTGESMPVQRKVGDPVLSGSTYAGEAFHLVAARRAAESTYAGIVRLVAAAQRSRAPMSRLADRYALVFLAAHRRARRSGLGLERRSHSRRGGAGRGDTVSAYPGRTSRARVGPVARSQAGHPDQGGTGAGDLGARSLAGDRQDRDPDPRPCAARFDRGRLGPVRGRAPADRGVPRSGIPTHHGSDPRGGGTEQGPQARGPRRCGRDTGRRHRRPGARPSRGRWRLPIRERKSPWDRPLSVARRAPGRLRRRRGGDRPKIRWGPDLRRRTACRHASAAAKAPVAGRRAHRASHRRSARCGRDGREGPVDRCLAGGAHPRPENPGGFVGTKARPGHDDRRRCQRRPGAGGRRSRGGHGCKGRGRVGGSRRCRAAGRSARSHPAGHGDCAQLTIHCAAMRICGNWHVGRGNDRRGVRRHLAGARRRSARADRHCRYPQCPPCFAWQPPSGRPRPADRIRSGKVTRIA